MNADLGREVKERLRFIRRLQLDDDVTVTIHNLHAVRRGVRALLTLVLMHMAMRMEQGTVMRVKAVQVHATSVCVIGALVGANWRGVSQENVQGPARTPSLYCQREAHSIQPLAHLAPRVLSGSAVTVTRRAAPTGDDQPGPFDDPTVDALSAARGRFPAQVVEHMFLVVIPVNVQQGHGGLGGHEFQVVAGEVASPEDQVKVAEAVGKRVPVDVGMNLVSDDEHPLETHRPSVPDVWRALRAVLARSSHRGSGW